MHAGPEKNGCMAFINRHSVWTRRKTRDMKYPGVTGVVDFFPEVVSLPELSRKIPYGLGLGLGCGVCLNSPQNTLERLVGTWKDK